MASSASVFFFIAVMIAMHLNPKHPIEWAFAIGRHGSAGFMVLYVEIWSIWNRRR
jgi:hypothetical protein